MRRTDHQRVIKKAFVLLGVLDYQRLGTEDGMAAKGDVTQYLSVSNTVAGLKVQHSGAGEAA